MPPTGRATIENPLVVDLSAHPVPPLKPLLQPGYRPSGLVQRRPDGGSVARTPWYAELAYPLDPATDITGVLYVLPADERTDLLVASIGDGFEVFFAYLSGPDHGDALTALVARHWPHVYRMLVASQTSDLAERIIGQVRTGGRTQWVVADPLRGADRDGVSVGQVEDLSRAALEVLLDALQFHLRLPGVLTALGGPDRVSRRLTALAGLFSGAADIGGTFQGGVQVDELYGLAKAAVGVIDHLRGLRD